MIGTPTVSVQLVSGTGTVSSWQVVGSATYAEKGSNTVTVSVTDVDGAGFTSSQTTINVAEAPLADATPATTVNALEGNNTGNTSRTLQPGTYVGGIHVSGNATVTFAAGTYYLKGGGFSVAGNASVTGSGVLIDNAPQSASDTISLSGNGSLTVNTTSSSGSSSQALTTVDGTSDTSSSGTLIHSIADLGLGMLTVAVDGLPADSAADDEARIEDAIATLDATLAPYGVSLVEVFGGLADSANIHIHLADTSAIGGVSDGVLGVTVGGNDITIIVGWNWFTGTDPSLIGAGQYDFQTVVTHELGHATGLGHSADTGSVMYPTLAQGAARHDLTAGDLTVIETAVDSQPEPLLAAPTATAAETARGDGLVGETEVGTVHSIANGFTLFTAALTSPQETNSAVGMFAPSNQFGAGEGRTSVIQVGNILRLPASRDVSAGGDNEGTGLIANWTWGDQGNQRRAVSIAAAVGTDSGLDATANGKDSAMDSLGGGMANDRFFRFKTLDKLSG